MSHTLRIIITFFAITNFNIVITEYNPIFRDFPWLSKIVAYNSSIDYVFVMPLSSWCGIQYVALGYF